MAPLQRGFFALAMTVGDPFASSGLAPGQSSLKGAELLAVLARRDARLTDQEQALVRAALAGAPPVLRAELEQLLGRVTVDVDARSQQHGPIV